jgi:hypothetical protein
LISSGAFSKAGVNPAISRVYALQDPARVAASFRLSFCTTSAANDLPNIEQWAIASQVAVLSVAGLFAQNHDTRA